ncbi:MAG TPA: hypothetical protein VFN68_03565 [Acidimicrobiales bacterium]|nr:hypothetical protein [Acidimicrobiales bacterium]
MGRTDVFGPGSNQGLATVTGSDGATRTVYTGSLTISAALRAAGWVHVGDPDSWHGWLVEPFQGPDGATAKMFRVTSPQGRITDAVHPLSPGEAANNSFAAVTPDGQWTVSGEWGEEDRLLVFPTPVVNTATRPGSPLPLSGTIALDRPVRDVQGCAFVSSTRLVCASSDPATDLWPVPDPLLQIDLAGPLSATSAGGPARVTLLGPIPLISPCPGTYEPEGVDMDRVTGILSLEVAPPGVCRLVTQVYRYRAPAGAGAAAGAASRAGAGSGAATATPTGTATGAPTGAATRGR